VSICKETNLLSEKLVEQLITKLGHGGDANLLVELLRNFRSDTDLRRIYFKAKLKFLEGKLQSRSNPFLFLQEFIAALSSLLPVTREEF
jgi:hypothetical protein